MPSKKKPTYLQKIVRSKIKSFIEQVNETKPANQIRKPLSQPAVSSKKPNKMSRYISKSVRVSVLHRDKYKCVFCGRSSQQVELQIDHIIPFSKGGSNMIDNLQTLCIDCNLGKSDRIL